MSSLVLGYGAGALSTLSPCVLPLLPMILFGALQQHALGPLALAAGLASAFAAVGVSVATFGFSVGIDPSTLRIAVAVLLVAMGAILLIPALQARLAAAASPVATGGQNLLAKFQPAGLPGQFVLGGLLGIIWSPCSGPTLGAALALAAQGETVGKATATMLAFGLGAATPIVALAYGSRHAVMARRDWMAQVTRFAKPLMGAAFVGVGAFVLTGLDKVIETSLTNAMPEWLASVTTRL